MIVVIQCNIYVCIPPIDSLGVPYQDSGVLTSYQPSDRSTCFLAARDLLQPLIRVKGQSSPVEISEGTEEIQIIIRVGALDILVVDGRVLCEYKDCSCCPSRLRVCF